MSELPTSPEHHPFSPTLEGAAQTTLTEEFLSWQTQVDRNGLHGLRATRIQEYRGSAKQVCLAWPTDAGCDSVV
jgi:hypothetical protein